MGFPNAGTIDTSTQSGTKEYLFAKMQTQQTANVAASDHVKFDTVILQRGANANIALDTTTAYSAATGAASIGRVTLKAGRLYHMRAVVPYVLGSGATGLVDLGFWDATANVIIPGTPQTALVATTATHDIGGGAAEVLFAPTVDTLVEVRIITATALTQLGTTGARTPSLFIESDV